MSIETTTSRVSYAGDGVSTANPVSFPFQEQADLVVKLFEVATGTVTNQTLSTHYTISGTVDPDFGYINGGTVNMITPVPTGTNLVIYRDPEVIQSLSIPTSGQLPSKPIERQLDLTTMVVQRVNDVIGRTVSLPDGFADTFDTSLPSTIALSGGAALVVNSAGDGFETGPDTTQIAAAAAAAASASVYSWYGAAGGTGDALTLTPSTALTAYATGQRIAFSTTATNTGAATLNISGLGIKSIKSQSGAALIAGDLTSGRVYTVTYDGTNFVLQELAKPEALSVDTAQLANTAVTAAKIASGTIHRNKLDSSTTVHSNLINNLGLSASVAANALTIALKTKAGTDPTASDYVHVCFRNATAATGTFSLVEINSALSLVIPSATTIGTLSATAENLFVYLINNAGTAELAVSTGYYDNGTILSTTAISGGATRGTVYSTTARSNVAVRLIGRIKSTQATAGTWVTSPSEIALQPFDASQVDAILVSTPSGYGSTNTNTRKYSVVLLNQSSSMTLTQSATNGDSITVNVAGLYGVLVSDTRAAGTSTVAASKNNVTFTSGLANICVNQGAAGLYTAVYAEVYLAAGDVVRSVHPSALNDGNDGNCRFGMVRIY